MSFENSYETVNGKTEFRHILAQSQFWKLEKGNQDEENYLSQYLQLSFMGGAKSGKFTLIAEGFERVLKGMKKNGSKTDSFMNVMTTYHLHKQYDLMLLFIHFASSKDDISVITREFISQEFLLQISSIDIKSDLLNDLKVSWYKEFMNLEDFKAFKKQAGGDANKAKEIYKQKKKEEVKCMKFMECFELVITSYYAEAEKNMNAVFTEFMDVDMEQGLLVNDPNSIEGSELVEEMTNLFEFEVESEGYIQTKITSFNEVIESGMKEPEFMIQAYEKMFIQEEEKKDEKEAEINPFDEEDDSELDEMEDNTILEMMQITKSDHSTVSLQSQTKKIVQMEFLSSKQEKSVEDKKFTRLIPNSMSTTNSAGFKLVTKVQSYSDDKHFSQTMRKTVPNLKATTDILTGKSFEFNKPKTSLDMGKSKYGKIYSRDMLRA